jgi:predicted DNA-binding transcriptional regulator AlpA
MSSAAAASSGEDPQPRPDLVSNAADFAFQLDRLRRRAAAGTARRKLGLDELARLTDIPRSTLHTYLAGSTLPPPDRLDVLVMAMGCNRDEVREWAQAMERVADVQHALRTLPAEDDVARLPTTNARARSKRALGLEHCWALLGLPVERGSVTPLPTVVCPSWAGSYVYQEPDPGAVRTGYLYAGNNWFVCQEEGAPNPALDGAVESSFWLYTQADVAHDARGGWGWVPANTLTTTVAGTPIDSVPLRRTAP